MQGVFEPNAALESVKMIELKLSQGAKPAHGGILPQAKITPEIAQIREVSMEADVISPPYHSEFNTPVGLMEFLQKLRDFSGGKPVGFKLCVGLPHEFLSLCKAMLETQVYPDFIAIDGCEGGTGAAPLEFSNSVGMPLDEGLVFVHNMLMGFDLKKHIRLIASGKIITGFQVLNKLALGADLVASARSMMLALGCIQARRCNSNHCPVGVATTNPVFVKGLHVPSKRERVYQYHKKTLESVAELAGSAGLKNVAEISRRHILQAGVSSAGEIVRKYLSHSGARRVFRRDGAFRVPRRLCSGTGGCLGGLILFSPLVIFG